MPLFAYPLAAAVMITSLFGGGFTSASRTLVIVLAGLTLLAAQLTDREPFPSAAGTPLVWVLTVLGVLSILSAAWTLGSARDTVRWGLVILAYGTLVVCSGRLAARIGVWPIAVGMAALAAVEALLGLGAVALHTLPDSEWFSGSWRPGGSFQYPPALGLLEVMALPTLLVGLRRTGAIASLSAGGIVLAGATVGCADSRLELGLAIAVFVIAVLWPPARGPRVQEVLAAIALAGTAALAGHLILGRHVNATQGGGGMMRLILIASVSAILAAEWLPLRALVRRRCRPRATLVLIVGLTAVMLTGASVISTKGASHSPPLPYPLETSITARFHLWKAALETWRDRPLLGAGAGAYYQGSAKYQGSHPSLFAHDLPLELAAELGTLGLLLGISLYVATIDILRRARPSLQLWLLGPPAAAFLVANLVDWPWHLAGLGAAWAVAVGGLLACDRTGPVPTPAEQWPTHPG